MLNIIDNSFTKAIFISLWEFSITLAASATFILSALCTPASITNSYTFATVSKVSSSIPDTTLTIVSNLWSLSPGFILSGEYPTLKSTPHFIPEASSSIGIHISSVTPGYTVDSYTTIDPFTKFLPKVLLAPITGLKSGVLSSLVGVGTATIWNLASFNLLSSQVIIALLSIRASFPTSFVTSIPFLYKSTFSLFTSKPITLTFLANDIAKGIPTYPKPITDIFSSLFLIFSYKHIVSSLPIIYFAIALIVLVINFKSSYKDIFFIYLIFSSILYGIISFIYLFSGFSLSPKISLSFLNSMDA